MKKGTVLALVLTLGTAADTTAQTQRGGPRRVVAAKMPDALRMPYSQQIQRFWKVLDECLETKPDFDIERNKREVGRPGSKLFQVIYRYSVKIPDAMKKALPGLRRSKAEPLLEMLLAQALRDKERSYYAALLAIHAGYDELRWASLEPLMAKNEDQWRRTQHRFVPAWFNRWWDHASERYSRWLFLRLLSAKHQRRMQVDKGVLLACGFSMSDYRNMKALVRKGRRPIGFESEIAMGDAVTAYVTKSDASLLEKLPNNLDALLGWAALLVNTSDKDVASVLRAFLRYAEARKHEAVLVDMALALLAVRGYDYDGEEGKYELNVLGRQLLEYAIQHPIPKLLHVTEILKKRWDEKVLLEMIQKHHPETTTWEKFRAKIGGSR